MWMRSETTVSGLVVLCYINNTLEDTSHSPERSKPAGTVGMRIANARMDLFGTVPQPAVLQPPNPLTDTNTYSNFS